jgi:phosphate transport system substrate-binding protein
MKQQSSSIVTLALILAAGGTNLKAIAQTAADKFPLPTTVPSGTKVQIDGSSSMQAVNQGLKERFQKQFPGTDVVIPTQYQGSDSGIKAIVAGKADVAGIGRALTKTETAQGIAGKEIGREKIAIIVNEKNPYTGNLTLKDFAKIYRGEVTDWSQLPSAKGAKGKIKVIDRPDTSDTRRAFANYPVFQNGKLKTGSNAQKLTEDSTQAVVDKLGEDGIGYAPADQIKSIPGIRAVTLHGTQPDNIKYPFSQPLTYAYKNKGGKISEGTKAFLGYVSDSSGQAAIKEAIAAGTTAVAGAATTTTTSTTETAAGTTGTTGATGTTTTDATNPGATGGTTTETTTTTTNTAKDGAKGGLPWWLLIFPVAGGLWWLLGRKKPTETVTSVTTAPETTPSIKPLYPPPPARTSRTDSLSGDLSGDLSSNFGGYRPSGDLRSGDLRSGDLSGTMSTPPLPTTKTPNINFNGVVDAVEDRTKDINLAGGAAIVGGAAAAAALGKGLLDGMGDRVSDIHPPEIKAPDIDLSNPLEGLKDKSSNLVPDLELDNPLEGIKGKASESIQDLDATLTGSFDTAFGNVDLSSPDLNLEFPDFDLSSPNLEVPDFSLPATADGIQAKAADLIPDVNLHPPSSEGIVDRVGDFFKDGGIAAAAAGGAAIAGGAAVAGGAGKSVSDFFGGQKDLDLSDDLSLESTDGNDPFNFGAPLESATDNADLILDDTEDRAFDFSNPLDSLKDKAVDLKDNAAELIPDFNNNDPFNFSNPLEAIGDKAVDLKDNAAELIPDLNNNDPFDFGDAFDSIQTKTGDFFTGGGAAASAAGAAAIAGGAALFGSGQKPSAEFTPNQELDTFDRDLEAINLDDLDEDPFAGLSDLLGEETGGVNNEAPKSEPSDFLSGFKDKASDLLADGKDFGGAALAGGAAATLGAGQALQSFFAGKDTPNEDRGEMSGSLYSEGQITLVSPSPTQAYAHWEIPVRLKRQLREQGGEKLVVRLYDVTNSDSNIELPGTFQEFECSDSAWDLEIPINQSEHRYLAEIGYVTGNGGWLMLARSAPLWIRSTAG